MYVSDVVIFIIILKIFDWIYDISKVKQPEI